VPSEVLEEIARRTWKQPAARLHRIANGIDTALYAGKPELRAIPGFVPNGKEVVIGALAGLREVKNLPLLVRACGGIAGRFRLVIVGEGPERAAIESTAAAMGIADRVVMPGFLGRPHRFVGHFPISVVEGMAAGLPVVSTPVGDVPRMVAAENAPFVTGGDEVLLRDALQALVSDAALRSRVGAANRAKARAEFDEGIMIARYKALYGAAMGRPGALG
jgi:glycosyltransferase involved in cell wall biosynthesis